MTDDDFLLLSRPFCLSDQGCSEHLRPSLDNTREATILKPDVIVFHYDSALKSCYPKVPYDWVDQLMTGSDRSKEVMTRRKHPLLNHLVD